MNRNRCPRWTGIRSTRSNIDKWDYQSVSKLSFFLAVHYPKANVHITEPQIKTLKDELNVDEITDKVEEFLWNKDCVIIGSPDVSDIAEIVLSQMHKIEPYKELRVKNKGFVLIKKVQPKVVSSFYWKVKKDEKEGVCLIKGQCMYSPNEKEKIHGIVAIGDNPFTDKKNRGKRKVMVFSGFSGISTYGMIKLFTDKTFRNKFESFCNDYYSFRKNVEALFTVNYTINKSLKGDNREFIDHDESINYLAMEPI